MLLWFILWFPLYQTLLCIFDKCARRHYFLILLINFAKQCLPRCVEYKGVKRNLKQKNIEARPVKFISSTIITDLHSWCFMVRNKYGPEVDHKDKKGLPMKYYARSLWLFKLFIDFKQLFWFITRTCIRCNQRRFLRNGNKDTLLLRAFFPLLFRKLPVKHRTLWLNYDLLMTRAI